MQEERHRIARVAAPFGRRIDDAVRGRRQHVVGQPLEHIADVDDHRTLRRIDREPFAVAVEQLEPRFFGPEQHRDEVDILMRPGADARRIGRNRRIVEQAQDAVPVAHRFFEPMFVEAEIERDGRQ